MRLLYLANVRMPTEKAHGLQIAKTIEALQKLGLDVKLLIPSRRNHIKTSLEIFYNLTTKINITYVWDPLRVVQMINERFYFPLQRLWFGLAAFAYGLFWPGAIYSRDITASFFLSLFGKQVAYEDHEPKRHFVWVYKFFLRSIPKKIIVAQHLVNQYQTMCIPAASYTVAPNGVDTEEFDKNGADKQIWQRELGFKNSAPIILYIGHFYSWKGVYTLLDAAGNIPANVVLIGGTKEDYGAIERYIREKKIANAYLHPFVPHHEVIQYLKSADILVLPNTAAEERSKKYTTPIKLFEYMASGIPIVASNIPSFSPYLSNKENALLCDPDNSRALATAINKLIQDHSLRKKISQAARLSVNKYSWQSRARIIQNFIKETI